MRQKRSSNLTSPSLAVFVFCLQQVRSWHDEWGVSKVSPTKATYGGVAKAFVFVGFFNLDVLAMFLSCLSLPCTSF